MSNPLLDILDPTATQLEWQELEQELKLGPYRFPAGSRLPLPSLDNLLGRRPWVQIPYDGRPPVSGGLWGDEEDVRVQPAELFAAYLEGHLPASSPDAHRLVDLVTRALLIHAVFEDKDEEAVPLSTLFGELENGAEVFDVLIRGAKLFIAEGVHHLEKGEADHTLYHYLIARLLYEGAHLISPTTPGVPYEIGILLFDLSQSMGPEGEAGADDWTLSLARESRYYLELALASEDVQNETPAFYLLGILRELLGDDEGAVSAYERFLASPAKEKYGPVAEEAEKRHRALNPKN